MRKPSALVYSCFRGADEKQRIEMPPSIHMPHTPWSRRRSFLIAAVLLTLLVLGYLWVAWFLPERTVIGCSRGERAVLEEFPHYGDQHQIRTHSAEVSCIASYTLRVTRSEVLSYYDERLRENGWEVGGYWAATPPSFRPARKLPVVNRRSAIGYPTWYKVCRGKTWGQMLQHIPQRTTFIVQIEDSG